MFIIIKPTEQCNLDCSYCFIDKAPLYSKMSNDDAIKIMSSIQEYSDINPGKHITVCWHGGEPLILGLNFYEQVLTKFPNIHQTIQTNLTLFNQEFSSLFAEHNVSISTSLDGPEKYHNRSRKFRGGLGSFQSVMKSIELAKQKNIKVGVICMLSKLNIEAKDTLYDFFKSIGLPYKMNSIHKVGRNDYDSTAITYREYADTLLYMFERFIFDSNPGLPEGQSFRFARSLLVNFNPACPFLSNCQDSIVSINSNGDAFPCESFPHIKNNSKFFYGNVIEKSFAEIMNSNNRRLVLSRRTETIKSCSVCKYAQICNGGCMIEGIIRRGRLFDPTAQCKDIKYMLMRFEEILQRSGLAKAFIAKAHEKNIEFEPIIYS